MKNIVTFLFAMICSVSYAQDFAKNMETAKNSYAGGNLEDARFAMQQMINDLDIAIGKEVLNLLPEDLGSMAANKTSDNVTANTGFAGVIVHRDYGASEKLYTIDIMGNSPMIASMNAMLSLPFMGNSGDGSQKVIKVEGYKGILQKTVNEESNTADYTLQIPVNSALLTLEVPDTNEGDMIKMANTIPVKAIAQMMQ